MSDLHFIARGFSKRHIALRLERAPSTICREIKRNRNRNGYFVKHAHKLAKIRHSSNHKTVDPAVWKQVKSYLALQWSPEQIASYIAGKMYSIYHYILQNKIKGGYLYQH
ncbi:IS30 family transposase [Acinetobacter sp. ANC 4470]|nr:IS30 family transposase [Acinetobacter sp. ANC 4470]